MTFRFGYSVCVVYTFEGLWKIINSLHCLVCCNVLFSYVLDKKRKGRWIESETIKQQEDRHIKYVYTEAAP